MTESILPKEQHKKVCCFFILCVCVCRIRVRFSFLRGCQSRKSSPRCFDKLLGIQCTHVKCQCGRFMYIFEIVVFVCAFVLDCKRHCFKCSKLNVSCFFCVVVSNNLQRTFFSAFTFEAILFSNSTCMHAIAQ